MVCRRSFSEGVHSQLLLEPIRCIRHILTVRTELLWVHSVENLCRTNGQPLLATVLSHAKCPKRQSRVDLQQCGSKAVRESLE